MSKRSFAIGLLLVLVGACLSKTIPTPVPLPGEIVLNAQTLPLTKTLVWDPSVVDATHPPPDNYVVTLDGVTIGSPVGTSILVTFTTPGAHAITVAAVDMWGSSAAVPLAVKVNVPNDPKNARFQ